MADRNFLNDGCPADTNQGRQSNAGAVLTATEDVVRNTPPSGLALKVGMASRSKWRLPLTLMAQHCLFQLIFEVGIYAEMRLYSPCPIHALPLSTGLQRSQILSSPSRVSSTGT